MLDEKMLKAIGQRLKKYRVQAGMTQKQLSEILEIDEQYYGQVERGVKKLSLEKLMLFCTYFQIPLDDVIKIDVRDEGNPIKLAYISEISQLLINCSKEQLIRIKSLVKNIDLL
ncbi:helix-turn-helix domain-containing protein [Anaeromassilibacillus senegalensis]|uniref:helix-turn-helix domain-containing protein n=1 Tax=Anaeromassilibacillus senegalensis TaxID=1673717 RepID=UPI0006814E13|nr:helix-turn-helix transcriptional regulator [Anaeromassilibacillus senegalensis]